MSRYTISDLQAITGHSVQELQMRLSMYNSTIDDICLFFIYFGRYPTRNEDAFMSSYGAEPILHLASDHEIPLGALVSIAEKFDTVPKDYKWLFVLIWIIGAIAFCFFVYICFSKMLVLGLIGMSIIVFVFIWLLARNGK